jgi:PAS domain S-box-containing protein
MNNMPDDKNRRVLVIDDNQSIHDDFRKILCPATATAAALATEEVAVFWGPKDTVQQTQFEVVSAYQGQEGVLLAQNALQAGLPYALAFVDVRMPPGWDGVETTLKLWELDPNLQVVLCTAYSDYSWGEMFEKFGQRDGLLILKKPFDSVEALQLAQALTEKWWLHQQFQRRMEELETRVTVRTRELQESTRVLQTEVAEHQRTEGTLRESEQQLRVQTTALDAAANAILIADHNGLIQSVNPAFTALTGYTAQEVVGQNPRILKSAKQDEAFYRNLWQTISSGQVWSGELINRRKDGSLYVEEMTITPLRDGQGVIARYIAIKQDITKRKRGEEALRASQEIIEGILNAIPVRVFWKDKNLVYLGCNAVFARDAGFADPKDIIGKDDYQMGWRDQAEKYRGDDHQVIESGSSKFLIEEPQTTPEGNIITLLSSKIPLRNSKGEISGVLGTYMDITERKRAEQELRWKTAVLEAQVNSSIDGILVVDQDRNTSLQNQRFVDLFKMPQHLADTGADEKRLRWITDIVNNPEQFAQKVDYLYANPNELSHDEIELKDGMTLDRYSSPAIGKDGKYYGRIWTFRDITERKKAEEALRLLSSAVDQSKESIVITDAQLDLPGPKILFVNPGFTKMTGYTAGEVIGKTPRILQGPRSDKAVLRRLRQNLERGEVFEGETINYRKDGTEFNLEWQIAPIRNASGDITHFVAIQHDITARKKLEARIVQSQKMETVGKLAGGIAHEFNSILTAIIGQSELLLGDLPAGSPLAKNAIEISRAAGRAATLTRQLLAYGRKQILQPETLDLNRVVASMEGMFHHLMGAEVDTQIVATAGLHPVKADAGQIEQVIMNMAINARDAMPNGGKLTLETANVSFDEESVGRYPELKAGDYVMLAITDTGAGMSEEVKARLFEPFFSTKAVGQGTGLGLSTCYGIVKQSGGHISVYSEVGRGATFKIYLPQVEPQARIPVERLESKELPRGTETILLVEDDPALRDMASTLLRRLGYTVWAAANGIEALSLKQQRNVGHVDLLFTDVVMPHMSGKELADRVEALFPGTRILFTSAYTESAIVHQGVLNKGVALLQKPFTPSALANKLREVLDQPGASTPETGQETFVFAK